MRALALSALLLVAFSSLVAAGEIYGSIKESGKPIKEGVKVVMACGEKKVAGETDKFGSQFLEKRQAEETRARFYSELIGKREEADSALRKDMLRRSPTSRR